MRLVAHFLLRGMPCLRLCLEVDLAKPGTMHELLSTWLVMTRHG
jgi:hypothetical protein